MPTDREPPENPFVKFKQHVDARINTGLQGVFGPAAPASANPQDGNPRGPSSEHYPCRFRRSYPGGPPNNAPTPSSEGDFTAWLAEQQDAVAAERRLNNYYEGHGFAEHMRRWQLFSYHSRYSPLRLSASHPRQPRPRDLPDGMDPSLFTFVDAFEDLLAESSGRPMLDLQTRYEMNGLLSRMWPHGEHPLSWFSRLESLGLTKSYFHYAPGRRHDALDRTGDWGALPWRSGGRDERDEEPGLEANPDAGGSASLPASSNEPPSRVGLFDELDRVFKVLSKTLDEEMPPPFGSRGRKDNAGEGQEQEEPGAEDDLYSVVHSAYQEAERSLSTFLRSFSEGRWGRPGEPWQSREKSTATGGPADQVWEDESGRTAKSTKEFVDAFGNLHVRTEIRRTDQNGNEVSRETHYSVRPVPSGAVPSQTVPSEAVPSQSRNVQDEELPGNWVPDDDGGSGQEGQQGKQKKSGWFWK